MLNKIMVIGHLGREPEMRYTPSGDAVCTFSVAATERWKKDGEQQERTEWFNVVAWGKLAEICGEWLKKGQLVYVEGSQRTEKYEKDGQTRYAVKLVASTMKMLGKKDGDGGDERPAATKPTGTGSAYADAKQGRAPAAAPKPSTGFDDMDDDIPFIVNTLTCEPEIGKVRRLRRASY